MTRPDEDLAPGEHLSPVERDLEAPEVDAAEQAAPAAPVEAPAEVSRGIEVAEWDAFEQSIVVDVDEDYER